MTEISIAGVGDVLIERADPTEPLREVTPLLEKCHLSIGNFEGVLTDTPSPMPGGSIATIVPTSNAGPLAVFDALSLANNHAMDGGYGGLADTIETLRAREVAVVGAGPSLAEARQPILFQRGGTTVAVLASTSVFRVGVEARPGRPGVAPLRVEDYYAQRYPGLRCPGVSPYILSMLDEDDWEALSSTLEDLSASADIVVVSVHWGDHTQPWVITDHERSCARLLIDAGADIVFGHHHHFFRGVETIQGKPVFYGLGHLAFDHPRFAEELRSRGYDVFAASPAELLQKFGEFGTYPRRESPGFPFPPLARRTGVAIVYVDGERLERSGVVPCIIDDAGVTRPVLRDTDEWQEALTFLAQCMEKGGLETVVVDAGWEHEGFDVLEVRPVREDELQETVLAGAEPEVGRTPP